MALRTLHLCNRVPFPPHDGGAIGIYDIITNLSALGCAVTVLAVNTPKHFQPDDVLTGKARLITVFVNTNLSPVKAFFNLFKAIPYNFERFYSEEYANRLIQLLKTEQFDAIQVEGSQMATYVPIIRKYSKAPVVLRAHNVEYTIWQRLAHHGKNPLKRMYLGLLASKIRNFERKYFDDFDAVAAITQEDKTRIEELGCTVRVEIIQAGVEMNRFVINPKIKPKPKTLFMIGSLVWLPNLEGIDWFLTHIWPTVFQQFPTMELHIAGSSPPEYLVNLQLPNVKMHGFVPSAAEFMQTYDLMLAPLLSGGGMRIKIIEGMALGKCILTTPVGAEGIAVTHNQDILLGPTPADWIKIIGEYAIGNLVPENTGGKAQRKILEYYDNKTVIPKYIDLYKELIGNKLN